MPNVNEYTSEIGENFSSNFEKFVSELNVCVVSECSIVCALFDNCVRCHSLH